MTRVLAAFLTALSLLASGCGSTARAPSAADQVPALEVALQRVDTALAAHRFAAARERLRALKAAVISAREAGDLQAVDAQRVLDAVARLMATLPEEARPTESSSPTTSATAKPSGPASKRPEQSPTRDSTPQSTPVPSSTPTPTSSPTPSPTATPSPTGGVSPIGATTATP
jgi:hypothetical protein